MPWNDYVQATTIPVVGDNVASAAPSGSATADLVSAAINTGGIIITAAGLNLTSGNVGDYIRLLIGGAIHLELITVGVATDTRMANGGFCAVEVPAGVAVSYAANKASSNVFGASVRVAWRHKV